LARCSTIRSQNLRIGDIHVVGINGEIYTNIGLGVKKASRAENFPLTARRSPKRVRHRAGGNVRNRLAGGCPFCAFWAHQRPANTSKRRHKAKG
jgi:hypothetical protein